MKIPKAKKLPSGMYRVQVMVDGRRMSITDEDPGVAEAKAAALKAKLEQAVKSPRSLTVGEAIDRYIESKDSVLSPSTILGYKRLRKNAFQEIMKVKLPVLTQEKVQRAVNAMAKAGKSPKYIRNAHGLLNAALTEYAPNIVLRTTLPQKEKYEVHVPTDEEIEVIMGMVRGTEMELPILLALWLGLRESEIRGITWDSISNGVLHIKEAIVEGEGGATKKGTKTYSGNRKIKLPQYIEELVNAQPHKNDHVIQLSGQAMYKRFVRLCEKAGVRKCRFHDLRHANASVMLALGVPDKYAMERMGHATNNMLKTVYQHTMKSKQDEVADMVDKYFEEKLHTKLHIKNRKT